MTPAVILGLENPTLFYEVKFYEKTKLFQDKSYYTAKDQEQFMVWVAKIAEETNAAAIMPYYAEQTWVNPKFEVTDWLVNLINADYKQEKTCS